MADSPKCPRCGAKGWELCRTPAGHLTTRAHKVRMFDAGVGESIYGKDTECVCVGCVESHGPPTFALDCCMGTGIVEYDHDCPIASHRVWAEKQFPKEDTE